MKKTLLPLFVLLVIGCASNQNDAHPATQNNETPLTTKAKNHVSSLLANPDSATFRNVSQKKSNLVCGEISGNEQNGNSTGFSTFYYQEKNGKIFSRIDTGDLLYRSIYRAHCQ